MTPSPQQLEQIDAALVEKGASFGIPLHWHATVDSTMPLAWQLAADAAIRSGAAVVADEQTAGKGRQGRSWIAPPELGLLASFLVRHKDHPIALNRLHMAAALAIADLCRHAGIAAHRIRCKWPNDIVLLDAAASPHKVAGILVETRLSADGWQSAVIGTGINVNQQAHDLPPQIATALPATSLRMALAPSASQPAPPFDRTALFVALCAALHDAFSLDNDTILQRWQSMLWIPTSPVIVSGGVGHYVGEMLGVDDDGALLLRDDSDTVHRLAAGDLSLRAPA